MIYAPPPWTAALGMQTTIERSLRARDWKVKDAHKMLMGTLAWRKSFKPTRCVEKRKSISIPAS